MDFRIFIEEQQISQPFYRVMNGIYGKGGELDKTPLPDKLGTGTYWTPRWDAVIMMLKTTFRMYLQTSLRDDNIWTTTVYEIDNAIMDEPPKDHKWAYAHGVDAGEQVLVKAISKPTVATVPGTNIRLKDIHPKDEIFQELISQQVEPVINHKEQSAKVVIGSRTFYASPNYNNYTIDIFGEPNPSKSWEYPLIKSIRSGTEWKQFSQNAKIEDEHDMLGWFIMDAYKDATQDNIAKAKGWLDVGQIYFLQ